MHWSNFDWEIFSLVQFLRNFSQRKIPRIQLLSVCSRFKSFLYALKQTQSKVLMKQEIFLSEFHLHSYFALRWIEMFKSSSFRNHDNNLSLFAGYFSLVNEKGSPTATQYTTMMQLVRERVYKFLSIDNMQAYTESNPSGELHSGVIECFFAHKL